MWELWWLQLNFFIIILRAAKELCILIHEKGGKKLSYFSQYFQNTVDFATK